MLTRSVALALAATIATAGAALKAPRPLVVVPFQLLANGVFVPVYVNGKGPFFFELDTGSDMSMVASETAGAIGLETKGSMQGMGAGSSSVGMAMICAKRRRPCSRSRRTESGMASRRTS